MNRLLDQVKCGITSWICFRSAPATVLLYILIPQVTPHFNNGEPITREYYDDWMSGNSNPAIGG